MARKVLLVEDDAALANLAMIRLKDLELDITHVSDGTQALDYLEQKQPDLILLDINIPMVDGWEVLNYAKRTYGEHGFKVIVTTARKDHISRAKGEMETVDRYLTKPFSGTELRDTVIAVLDIEPSASEE